MNRIIFTFARIPYTMARSPSHTTHLLQNKKKIIIIPHRMSGDGVLCCFCRPKHQIHLSLSSSVFERLLVLYSHRFNDQINTAQMMLVFVILGSILKLAIQYLCEGLLRVLLRWCKVKEVATTKKQSNYNTFDRHKNTEA